jgi:regulator of RNase E activity RraA
VRTHGQARRCGSRDGRRHPRPAGRPGHGPAWQEPIACGGVAVLPDDVIVADRDGAVVIPAALVDEIADAGEEGEALESWIMSEVEKGVPLPGLYPPDEATAQRYRDSRR